MDKSGLDIAIVHYVASVQGICTYFNMLCLYWVDHLYRLFLLVSSGWLIFVLCPSWKLLLKWRLLQLLS